MKREWVEEIPTIESELIRGNNLNWGETSSADGCVGTTNKKCSPSQAFKVQTNKHSRPHNEDLTPLNPRETSWVPDTVRTENERTPSTQSYENQDSNYFPDRIRMI